MPHPSKAKGNAGELELAKKLKEQLGDIQVSRTGYMQSGDSEHFDLFIPGVGLECKRYKRMTESAKKTAWSQAFAAVTQASLAGKIIPAVAYREDFVNEWRFIVPVFIEVEDGIEIWDDMAYANTLYLEGFCYWWREIILPRLSVQPNEGMAIH